MAAARESVYGDVVLVTGASSGIGKYIAEAYAKKGFKVYGTSRQPAEEHSGTDAVKFGDDGFVRMIRLDVRSCGSVSEAVNYVINAEGRLGILINNAGFGMAGSVEDTSPEEAYEQFDTNFFGAYRMCRQVIPHMRAAGKGLIINIGSVAGLISIPYQAFYSASKYGVEALTEALRHEVAPFGIKVTLLEPGDTKTGFTGKRRTAANAVANSAYTDRFMKSLNRMANDEMSGPEPVIAAKEALKLAFKPNPPIRRVLGFEYKTVFVLKKLLPARLTEYVVSKLYG